MDWNDWDTPLDPLDQKDYINDSHSFDGEGDTGSSLQPHVLKIKLPTAIPTLHYRSLPTGDINMPWKLNEDFGKTPDCEDEYLPYQVVRPGELPSPQLTQRSASSISEDNRISSLPSRQHSPSSSPKTIRSSPKRASKAAKRSRESVEDYSLDDSHAAFVAARRQISKTSHSKVEARYRTKLNDSIATLRQNVPEVCDQITGISSCVKPDEDVDTDVEETLKSKRGPRKAEVVTAATRYIHHLRTETKYMVEENRMLKTCLRALEVSQLNNT